MNAFSDRITRFLSSCKDEATRYNSSTVKPEHMILALLRGNRYNISDTLAEIQIDTDNICQEIEENVTTNTIQDNNTEDIQLNSDCMNIMRLSILEARKMHSMIVEPIHLLLAILHSPIENEAKMTLENNNITYDNVVALMQMNDPTPQKHIDKNINTESDKKGTLLNSIDIPDEEDEEFDSIKDEPLRGNPQTKTAKKQQSDTPALDNFSVDLTVAASEGKLDAVIGREQEIRRVTEILCRRKKNNPVLIGEPGVGKSAIVEGLAQMIHNKNISPALFNKRVVALDLTSVVAGTKYRGQFEERIKMIIKELEQNKDIIVFIDEIHTIIGAGSAAGTMDAANILKPALARGTIQCIGATTLDEYRKSIEKDGALERRFQKVLVEPTTAEETRQILANIAPRYEKHHHVKYSEEALEACVRLTQRYITDRAFPDKAIDALDEVGSKIHLNNIVLPASIAEIEKEIEEIKAKKKTAVFNQNFELAASYRDKQVRLENKVEEIRADWQNNDNGDNPVIMDTDVAEVVALMSGVPVQNIAEDENKKLINLGNTLKDRVIGQDKAIEKTTKAIQRNRIGLHAHNRPIGTFMFLGPTGVGKTYLAQQLAIEMFGSADALIRVDMSEYNESFNTSRLVGAPPGYVGYDEGGQLTERVRRHPYSIVLLDEIEKAHSNVYNLLLQVLDEGRMTDGNGRLIDFRNTIIIMTSNAGTRQLKDFGRGIGYTSGSIGLSMDEKDKEYARGIIQKALSKQFSPEFLNRLDDIITFDQLNLESIKKIIDLEMCELYKRTQELGYSLSTDEEAKEFIASKGYDVQFGARPLKRAIQNYVEDRVCELILDGKLHTGDNISITVNDSKDALTFNISGHDK